MKKPKEVWNATRAVYGAINGRKVQWREGEPDRAKNLPKFFTSVHFSPTAILSQDQDKRINLCNYSASQLFGFDDRELDGKLSSILVPEDPVAAEERKELIDDVILNKVIRTLENSTRIKKYGERIQISAQVIPYRLENGLYQIVAIVKPAKSPEF